MRTPLNTMSLGVKLSLEQLPKALPGLTLNQLKKVEHKQLLEETALACDIAVDKLSSLLLYDRLESGCVQLAKQSIPVGEIVSEATNSLSSHLKDRTLQVCFVDSELSIGIHIGDINRSNKHVPKRAWIRNLREETIQGDKHKLIQVLRNLLSNSIKFTSESAGTILITVSFDPLFNFSYMKCIKFRKFKRTLEPDITPAHDLSLESTKESISGHLIIEVKDNGIGIIESAQSALLSTEVQFNPGVLQGSGSGLGLNIAKRLVDLHHGIISVTSDGEGTGATFKIALPMARNVTLLTAPESSCTEGFADLHHQSVE